MHSEVVKSNFALSSSCQLTSVQETSSVAEVENFQNLWQISRVSLRSYLACHLPNSSLIDDCLQEIAVLAWRKAPKSRGGDEFLAYCMGCAKRVRKASIRKSRSGSMLFLAPDVASSLAETVAEIAQHADFENDRLNALRECVGALDDRQREILEARYGGSSPDQMKTVAYNRNQSLPSLYKQIERLRDSLRSCVERKTLSGS